MTEVIQMLTLPDEFVQPAYHGRSIANVPQTVARLLHAEINGLPPLPDSLWRPIAPDLKRVVLLIIDGWGQNLLQKERPSLIDRAQIQGELTSIFPSTTVAALSTLWTGVPPIQHGLIGLNIFFPEFAAAGQMIHLKPLFVNHPDALVEGGLNPEQFLAVPGFAAQLANYGVPTYSFKQRKLIGTALSQMHGRGVAGEFGSHTLAEMLVQMRHLLEDRAGETLYLNGYWPAVDMISHDYGWDHPASAAELHSALHLIERELLDGLSAAVRKDTAVFVVADHGQIATSKSQHVYLHDHPALRDMLFMRPTGEARVPYFTVKHGRQTAVLNYLRTHLADEMVALPSDEALQAGLFGPPPHLPAAVDRLGDVVGIMRDGYAFLSPAQPDKAHHMNGRHAGMTAAEMQVPWLGFRLDA